MSLEKSFAIEIQCFGPKNVEICLFAPFLSHVEGLEILNVI